MSLKRRSSLGAVAAIDKGVCGAPPATEPESCAAEMVYQMDILAAGLEVVFCGLNPATSAAASGRNFSHPTNRFWSVLQLAGFTDVRLDPRDERRLLEYRCGLTAVVPRPTRRAAEVASAEFKQARAEFEAKMRYFAPRSIAFLGKRALSTILGKENLDWGLQPNKFAATMTWVLPNPSGLNRSFRLPDLVDAYGALRTKLYASAKFTPRRQ